MKRPFMFSATILALLIFASCEKDIFEDDIDNRDKFVGTWSVSDQILAKANYRVTITKDDQNSVKMWVSNFNGLMEDAFVYIDNNEVELPEQDVSGFIVNGDGVLQGQNTIKWIYWVNDGAEKYSIQATYQKN